MGSSFDEMEVACNAKVLPMYEAIVAYAWFVVK